MTQWHRHTQEEAIEIIHQKHGDKITVIGKYISARDPIEVHCNVCGENWSPIFSNLQKGEGCKKCGRKRTNDARRNTHEDFLTKLEIVHGKATYVAISEYFGYDKEILIFCNWCQQPWKTTPASVLHNGCPHCWEEKRKFARRLTQNEVDKRIYALHKGKIRRIDPYTRARDKIRFYCEDCEEIWPATPDSVMRISGCPYCSKKSIGEKFIAEYLKDNNIDMQEQVSFEDCISKRHLRFDFLIGTKCLIEYDGIQHFDAEHQFGNNDGEQKLNEIRYRDTIKDNYCIEHQIKLFRIKFVQGKREKIKSSIYSTMSIIMEKLKNEGNIKTDEFIFHL